MLLQHSFFINKKQLALFSSASQRRSLISISLFNPSKSRKNSFFAGVLTVMLMLFCEVGWGQTQTFDTPGTYTFTVPAGVTSIKVECWGGGGAGGGSYAGAGGGGGGGAYNTTNFTVTAGQVLNITVGAGGTGGNNAKGGNGGTTTVSGSPGTISANGGTGGNAGSGLWLILLYYNVNGTGGAGGTGGIHSGGDVGISEGNGAGGGGGAGNNGNGGNGGNTTTGAGGSGNPNNPPYIGGNGGSYISQNNNGQPGNSPGGGGGGSRSNNSTTSRSGGAGAAGQVIISWSITQPTITSFSPTSACSGSSASVVITGTNFTGATAVNFYNSQYSTVTVNSATQITATLPAGATTGPISVTTPSGTATSSSNFTVNTLPTPLSLTGSTICASPGGNGTITSSTSENLVSYQLYNSGGTPQGGAQSGAGFGLTWSGLDAGTGYYVIGTNGTCTSTSNSVNVSTYDDFTSGTIETTGQTICYAGTPSVIGSATDASGGDGNISYSWRSSADGYFTAISGAISSTYTPSAGLTTTTSYQRYASDGTCNTTPTVSTGTWTVTVRDNFTSGTIETTGQTICYAGTPSVIGSATDASGGDGNISYSWRSSADGYATAISGATSSTYTPSAGLTTTTSYQRYASDGTCNTTLTISTGTWTVTVSPTPVVNNPSAYSFCSGEPANIVLEATPSSTFSWKIGAITGIFENPQPVVDGTSNTINQTLSIPNNATTGSVEYLVTPTSTTGSCVGAPFSITVTVEHPAIGSFE